MSKWTSEAGPIQTKRVDQAIKDFFWHSKAVRELGGVIGVNEHGHNVVKCMLGGPTTDAEKAQRDKAQSIAEEIGNEFGWLITRDNHKQVIAAFVAATKAWEVPVEDNRITPEEDAAQKQRLAEINAERQAKSREKAKEVEKIAAQLRAKYPWAEPPGGDLSCQARAAKNIKRELQATFPGVKFSVRSSGFSMGNSVDVRWTCGPTTKQIDAVIGKYQQGSFNGMIDMYEYDHSAESDAVSQVLGQSKYVHSSRQYPDGLHETVGQWMCEKQNVAYEGQNTRNVFGDGDSRWLSDHVHELVSATEFPRGVTTPIGIEDAPAYGEEGYDEEWRPCFRLVFPEAPAVPEGSSGTNVGTAEVTKQFHTKRQEDYWLVTYPTVDRDEFLRLKREAQAVGGWYSRKWGRIPGGFGFSDPQTAHSFAAEHFETVEEAAA